MALSSENNKLTFTAQAGDTVFNFVLPYFDDSDINVEIERANGSIVDSSTYSFTVAAINGNRETGATVTLSSITLAANDKVTILRNVPITQQYDLQEGGTIDPVALNKALDRVVAQNQQQENRFGRTITFPETDANTITYNVDSSATDRAGKVLGFDSSGNVTELAQIQGSASVDSGRGLQLINNQIGVKDDGITNQFIADDAVDTAQIANDAVEQAQIADNAVGTAQVANSAITKAKMENVNNMRVLGNTSGSTTAPQEVSVLDEDNMVSDSATALATQQSIKAYVDLYKPNVVNNHFSTTSSHNVTTNSNTFNAIPNTATTITPRDASSKFLVNFSISYGSANTGKYAFKIFQSIDGGAYSVVSGLPTGTGVKSHFMADVPADDNEKIQTVSYQLLISPTFTLGQTVTFRLSVGGADVFEPRVFYINRNETTGSSDDSLSTSSIVIQEIYQ